jgi:hypothetical protein
MSAAATSLPVGQIYQSPAAISVCGLGIIVHPLGAFDFRYSADRYGRKDALLYALVPIGTHLLRLTPNYKIAARCC